MVVQHNLTAMNANRMLGITTGEQAKSSEKLSSGYQINRAADDAAGLSISEKMRKQMRGLDRASTNAEDGISAVQTAEGALAEVHSMLQRMNELAVQAANGTNSVDDRNAIQAEVEELTTEINRVAESTKFNETYLLKGSNSTKNVYINAKDAGLNGTLVQGATGTSTFTMDLNVGEKVSIGGADYRLYKTGENDIQAVQGKIWDAVDGVSEDAQKGVVIDGSTYTYTTDLRGNGTDVEGFVDSNGNAYTGDQLAALVGDGATVTINGTTTHVVDKDADDAKTINQAITLVENALTDASSIGGTVPATAKLQAEEETPQPDIAAVKEKIGEAMGAKVASVNAKVDATEIVAEIGDMRDAAVNHLKTLADGDQEANLIIYFEDGTQASYKVCGTVDSGDIDGVVSYKKADDTVLTNGYNDIIAEVEGKLKVGETVKIQSVSNGFVVKADTTTPVSSTDLEIEFEDGTIKKYTVDVMFDEDGNVASTQWKDENGGDINNPDDIKNTVDNLEITDKVMIAGAEVTVAELVQDEELLGSGTYTFDIKKATVEVQKELTFSLHVGADTDMTNKINVNIAPMDAAGLGIKGINVADATGIAATYAIDSIADAITKVSAQRSALGAIQNRLEHTIANLDNVVENTTAAESRIRDTDMAEEMVEFSKNNILAQAGQSMLAQANQSTQGVLSILG